MNILALETATDACSVALSIKGETRQRFQIAPQRHTELLLPTRVAVSGRASGPNLFPMLEILGRARSVSRIRHAVELHAARP